MGDDPPRKTPSSWPSFPLTRGFGRGSCRLGPIPFAHIGNPLVREPAGIRDLSEEPLCSKQSFRYPVSSIVARDIGVADRLFRTGLQLSSAASPCQQFEFSLRDLSGLRVVFG